jgi:hypothetical protein
MNLIVGIIYLSGVVAIIYWNYCAMKINEIYKEDEEYPVEIDSTLT